MPVLATQLDLPPAFAPASTFANASVGSCRDLKNNIKSAVHRTGQHPGGAIRGTCSTLPTDSDNDDMEDEDEEHMKVIAVSSTQGSTAHECAAPLTSAHARPAVHSTAEAEAGAATAAEAAGAAGRSIEGADGEWDPESISKAGTGETGRSRSADEGEDEGEAEVADTLLKDRNEDEDAVEDEEMDANADSLVTGYRPAVLPYAEAGGRLAFAPCVDVLGPLWRGRARADVEAEVEEANRVFEYGDGIEV